MRFLSRFYIDGFILGILGSAILGSIFPASGTGQTILDWATRIAIGILFLLYGVRLSPTEALQGLKHWRLHSVVLAATFLLFPLIGLALRVLVPGVLSQDLYTGILYLCLVPSTVQTSIAFTSLAKGNVAGAIVSASLSNLIGVFVTPALVILLMSTGGGTGVGFTSILNIVLQLLVPFFAGQLLRPFVIDWLQKYREPTKFVDRGSIFLVVFSAFSASMSEGIWHTVSVAQVIAVVVVCALLLAAVLAITALAGRTLGFSPPDRIVIVFCGSKKSLAAGLAMASVLFAGQPVGLLVLPLMIFHQIQLIVCAAIAQRYARRNLDESHSAARR
ncbi:bile acid:sodium symporter family protein [Rhodococcus marinonascens]|uniref:bile acid:sodium symporter family protein n=1 Tax=Rhodococcus marinonascens TaxID=38311 RepID=UPI0009355D12|nr:bile acid:sodium symporter family protein [Rhodococcus marinonascens]